MLKYYQQFPMQPLPEFQKLSELHQNQVLLYLQTTGSENIQQAIIVLKRFNMNANEAIQHIYNQKTQNIIHPEQQELIQSNKQQQLELIRYNSHLRDLFQKSQSIGHFINQYRKAVCSFAKDFSKCLLPQCLNQKIFYSKFQKMYKQQLSISIYLMGLEDAFEKGISDQKCVAIIISPENKSYEIAQLLSTPNEITQELSRRFITIGTTIGSSQFKKLDLEGKAPCLTFAHKTIFGEINIIQTLEICQLTQITIKQIIAKYRSYKRKDKNIMIRYSNKIYSMYNQGYHFLEQQIPEDAAYQSERLLLTQQKQEYQQAQSIRKESIKRQEMEKLRKESISQDRKIRKASIPEQPKDGDIILLNFRCPNGNKISRNFRKDDKIQLIFCWVETSQDIQFQDQDIRKFQLLRGYPPSLVSVQDRQKLIQEIMQGDRQNILIREL